MLHQISKTTVTSIFVLALCGGLPFPSLGQKPAALQNSKALSKSVVRKKSTVTKKPILKPVVTREVTITVRPQSEVIGSWFTLGEIADIKGGDKTLRDRLSAIQVGVSPLPGLSRIIWPGDITVRLRSNKLDIPQLRLDALPETKITRASNSLEADEVTKAALIAGQIAIKDIPDATLEPSQTAQKIVLPTGRLLIVAGGFRGTPESGSITIPVTMVVDGKAVQTVEVALKVRRKARVLLAKRAISPHEILTADDVYLAIAQLPAGFTQPCLDFKDAVGKRTRRNLMADLPISTVNLEIPPAINANDKITIEWIFGTARITAPGLSHQTGFIGDTIRVFATDTKKELDAVVVDSRTVRIMDSSDSSVK